MTSTKTSNSPDPSSNPSSMARVALSPPYDSHILWPVFITAELSNEVINDFLETSSKSFEAVKCFNDPYNYALFTGRDTIGSELQAFLASDTMHGTRALAQHPFKSGFVGETIDSLAQFVVDTFSGTERISDKHFVILDERSAIDHMFVLVEIPQQGVYYADDPSTLIRTRIWKKRDRYDGFPLPEIDDDDEMRSVRLDFAEGIVVNTLKHTSLCMNHIMWGVKNGHRPGVVSTFRGDLRI